MGGTQRMAERAGTARARGFVMRGRLYDAATLHAWGVVNRVLGTDERTAALASHLFETDDCKNAVQSFLRQGPGKATFTGNL